MTRRPGLSLTEVLVTLGILAFGITAILTLFPLAASQMGIAVREDRCSQAAAAADGYFRIYWKTEVVEKPLRDASRDQINVPGSAVYKDDLFTVMGLTVPGPPPVFLGPDFASPGPGPMFPTPPNPDFPVNPTKGLPAVGLDEPSYPVVIDPMGWAARSTRPSQAWLGHNSLENPNPGTQGQTCVPRRTLVNAMRTLSSAGTTRSQFAFRLCSLMDGLSYDEDGQPLVDRELRYNWLWVLQRPRNRNQYAVNMTVVVFDNRAHLHAPDGSEDVFYTPTASRVQPGSNTIVLQGVPELKAGGWIMDATVSQPPVIPVPGARRLRHANFYQVVSVVQDTPNAGQTTLELQSPIKTPSDNNNNAYDGTFVVMRGVAGVYVRTPALSADGN